MAGPANNGGRRRGAKNYKNEVLTNIIAGILPNGQYGWDQVAAAYMTAAKEDNLRDTDDLKRHWVKNLCNGMKKPTGGTGEKGERIHKCIAIERLILDKTHSGILGLSPDEDEEGGGSNSDTSGNNYTAEVAPSPPPPVDGETKEDEDNELSEIKLARILDSSMTDTPGDTLNFPRPLSCSSSTVARPPKNQKTKNSSNKNRDRTSIAGSISKLIDSLSTNTDKGEDVNVAKRMNILMMRQLDSMERRMEMRDKEDRKEQRKKKKKRQKKKRAKKRAKKAT